MTYSRAHTALESLRQILLYVPNKKEALKKLTSTLANLFDANVVRIFIKTNAELLFERWEKNNEASQGMVNWTVFVDKDEVAIAGTTCELPLVVSDRDRARLNSGILKIFRISQVCSYAAVPIVEGENIVGVIEIAHIDGFHRWRRDDIFILQEIASILVIRFCGSEGKEDPEKFRLATYVDNQFETKRQIDDIPSRLARYSNLVFIKTDTKLKIQEVLGDVVDLLGISVEELKSGAAIWRKFIGPKDLRKILRAAVSMRSTGKEFSLEIGIIKPSNNEKRRFLVHGLPAFDGKQLVGFEGFGIDVTEKTRTEDQITSQKKRIEALYQISRSTQSYVDPALVMLKALKAVIGATNSDCGMGCLYDSDTDRIEVAAVDGLSKDFADKIEDRISKSDLIRSSIREKRSFLLSNVQEDPRALVDIVRSEGVKSTLVVPLIAEDNVLGVIVLYCRVEDKYSQADLELVETAANQIAAASRQADYYAREKRQADAMKALYKISHELSKYVSIKEVSERAIPILQKEFPCKRIWIGVMNEHATHIAGQAGTGPGIRLKLVNIQIELYLRHDFLDQAIRTKQPVVVEFYN
jgi:GAF domain-containing protein